MQTTASTRRQSEDIFAFSFIAAVAAYSLFSSWLHLVSGLIAFLGGFVLAFLSLWLMRLLEDRRLREAHRTDRMDVLFRMVEKSNAGKPV